MKAPMMNSVSIVATSLLTLALAGCGGGGGEKPAAANAALASCVACHSFKEGGPRSIGPNLYGIIGKTAGTQQGFTYSQRMKESGLVWTRESLDAFLASPRKVIPGTRMGYLGMADPAARQAAIAAMATSK